MLPYDEAGSGEAIILLHAGVADRTMFSEHLAPFAEAGFRAIALDLPGFGEAPVAAGASSPWAAVLAMMEELEIERAALVGNSFGGAVALRAAYVAPERVSRLVLVSAPAPGVPPSRELEAAWEDEDSALERGDIDGAVAAVVRAWTLPDAPEQLRERVAAMQRRAFALQVGAEPVEEEPDPLDENPGAIATVDIETLASVGARDMRDFLQSAETLAETMPRARHALIEGAGHLAPLETPAAFRRLVLDFQS